MIETIIEMLQRRFTDSPHPFLGAENGRGRRIGARPKTTDGKKVVSGDCLTCAKGERFIMHEDALRPPPQPPDEPA